MKIYILNPEKDFSEPQLNRLRNLGNVYFINGINELDKAPDIYSDEEKIIGVSPDYTDWKFSNETIDNIPNIRALCLATTTHDYVGLDHCKKKDILVTNIPNFATNSVAEYLLFLAMCLAKKLPLQLKNNNRQDFSPDFLQKDLKGKTAGIIGLGNIGQRVAELCKDMQIQVIYWSQNTRNEKFEYENLDILFEESDFIFCTLAINEDTKKLITDDLLNKMQLQTNFISGTGTSLHNHNLLIEKVANSEIYGYALEEPNRNLFDYDGNVMVTSEYAWFTAESTELRMNIWIDSIESISAGKPINLVCEN